MDNHFNITFSNGQIAQAIRVHEPAQLSKALSKIDLEGPRPILVVVGGASNISEASLQSMQKFFVEVLAPIVESLGAYVVDGGTDVGVMQLMGQARAQTGCTFPLIGVATDGKIALPNQINSPADSTPLEPNHTHFILIPGEKWGDESPWMVRVATVLAAGDPSVTVLLNGGEITFQDALCNVIAGRLVLVVAGTGRTADKLASALHGEPTNDERCKQLVESGLLQDINIQDDFSLLAQLIQGLLSSQNQQNLLEPNLKSDSF